MFNKKGESQMFGENKNAILTTTLIVKVRKYKNEQPYFSLYFHIHNTKNSHKYIDLKRNFLLKNIVTNESHKYYTSNTFLTAKIYDSKNNILECGFTKIDYFEVRNEENLAKLRVLDTNKARILVAAYINEIRLIDNLIIE